MGSGGTVVAVRSFWHVETVGRSPAHRTRARANVVHADSAAQQPQAWPATAAPFRLSGSALQACVAPALPITQSR